MARHELRFDEWRRESGKDVYALYLTVERDDEYLGCVEAAISGPEIKAWRNDGGDVERLKQALTSWAVDELQREVEAGRGGSEWQEAVVVLGVDTLAVKRLAASGGELPELVEGEVVGSFDA